MYRIYLTKTGLDRQYVGPTFTTKKEAQAWKKESAICHKRYNGGRIACIVKQ